MSESRAAKVVSFWRDAGQDRWFGHDEALDRACRERFGALHEEAARGELDGWSETPEGALALVILTDQMPRNMFRGTPRAFATDPLALTTARQAVARGFDNDTDRLMRQIFYLPFMHAEDAQAQQQSLAFYEAYGDAEQMHYARHHAGIVQRFGRFPHRNAILGRTSTPQELAFLDEDDFRG